MKIWKFRLEPFEVVRFDDWAWDTEPLSVIEQNGEVQLYARMGSDKQKRPRAFACVPTGDTDQFPALKDRLVRKFIGTVSVQGFVFHVHEVSHL